MAGLSYINFLPAVVNALAGKIGFSHAEAGQIVSSNGYGGILGSIIAIFVVKKIPWRIVMIVVLSGLFVVDITTQWLRNMGESAYGIMLLWRFLGGVLGGISVGIAFSVLARLHHSERAFGLLLFIQFSIGSIVIYVLPTIENWLNEYAVFYVMASFVALSLMFIFWLPSLEITTEKKYRTVFSTNFCYVVLVLIAIGLYQMAASAIWAYAGLIGTEVNIESDKVSLYIASTGLLGLLGAMLPMLTGDKSFRLYWVLSGVLFSFISVIMLNFSSLSIYFYIVAIAILFFSWPAVLSYLLAMTADFDASGKLSSIAALVSSVGLASGPLLGASLLDNNGFSWLLYTCSSIFLACLLLLWKPLRISSKSF